jgi:hypothetical protein
MFCDLVGSTALSTRLDPEGGQALAAVGRGCARANRAALERLINEAERAGYLLALPALRKAGNSAGRLAGAPE